MKKTISIIMAILMLFYATGAMAETTHASDDSDFMSQISSLVSSTMSDDYIGSLNLTIGSDTMILDGREIKIDNEGSIPTIENDTTLLPIRGVAEAIGAKVDYDAPTQTISLCSEETDVTMQLGSTEIEINGVTGQMPVAAKVVNDRTLIPLRAATEALGCEVIWDGDSQTISLTRPYQSKRIIVYSEDADTSGASTVIVGEGMTVMQFDTEDDAKRCEEQNASKGLKSEPDYIYKAASLSWGTDKINAPSYYNAYGGQQSDLIVAVIDSGLDSSNSCFNNKVVAGYDIYNNDRTPEDVIGHGTHVASTVADVTAGFNKVKIMPVKVFGSEDKTSSLIVDKAIDYSVSKGADVINLSLGGVSKYKERKSVSNAISKNITVVAAAGNDNVNMTKVNYSPACIPGVVTVSAVDSNNKKASFSNYGNGIIDIAAPGVGINGAAIGGGTTVKNGTSMATPHIAGAIALIRSVNPGYSSTDAINALKGAASDLGNNAYYGAGIANLGNLIPYSPPKSDITVNTLDARNISQTNATVYGSASYSGTRPSEVGLYFGTSSGSLKKVAHESIDFSKNPFDIWYDLNDEAGQYLSPGTTYYYQFYAIQNGTEARGSINSFTTIAPESANMSVTTGGADSITATNATVRGGASYSGTRPSEVGLYFGTSPDNMTIVARDYIDFKKNPFDIWYDLNSEAGQYLSTNTTYYYRIYGIQNGVEIDGETKSFTTSGGVSGGESSYTAYVVNTGGDTLAINSIPQKGNQIGEIPMGAALTVYPDRTSGNWYWVEYNGISGYSYKDYISANPDSNKRIGVIHDTGGSLAINRRPQKGDQIGAIQEGASVTVYTDKTSGNWYWVEYNGVSGYSYKDYIALQ